MTRDVFVTATAGILPEEVVSNREIGERLLAGQNPADPDAAERIAKTRARSFDIEKKTGLRERRFFDPRETPQKVGTALLDKLLAGRDDDGALDAVIVASSSSHGFPGLSQQIVGASRAAHPEMGNPFVLDIGSNACTGFMYALTVGSSLIRAMGYRNVACLAVEFSSRCISYTPQAFATSTLFGDAAAALLLSGAERGIARVKTLRASSMIEDDQSTSLIKGNGMHVSRPNREVSEEGRWYMAGPPVAIGAIRILISEFERYRDTGERIDWLIPHQANLTRIMIPACEKVGFPVDRMCTSFAETGNTSSAGIPLLFDRLVRGGAARAGESVLMIGFGASFSVGSALLELDELPSHPAPV